MGSGTQKEAPRIAWLRGRAPKEPLSVFAARPKARAEPRFSARSEPWARKGRQERGGPGMSLHSGVSPPWGMPKLPSLGGQSSSQNWLWKGAASLPPAVRLSSVACSHPKAPERPGPPVQLLRGVLCPTGHTMHPLPICLLGPSFLPVSC